MAPQEAKQSKGDIHDKEHHTSRGNFSCLRNCCRNSGSCSRRPDNAMHCNVLYIRFLKFFDIELKIEYFQLFSYKIEKSSPD